MPVAGHGPHHAGLFHARRYDVFPGALNGAATNRQTQLTEPLVIHALLVRREVPRTAPRSPCCGTRHPPPALPACPVLTSRTNPASHAVAAALPRDTTPRQHHRALPYEEVVAALQKVRESDASLAAKLLSTFTTLTASRSGEARLSRLRRGRFVLLTLAAVQGRCGHSAGSPQHEGDRQRPGDGTKDRDPRRSSLPPRLRWCLLRPS